MDVIVIGAGPAGLTTGAALARRGHGVVAVDRDPGPARDGSWRRRGVMQFEHPHGFRPQVRELLLAEWPEAWRRWTDLGAELVDLAPEGGSLGVRSRRSTYERALRDAAADLDGLSVVSGHVDAVVERAGGVSGVVVDGAVAEADFVVDAGGGASRGSWRSEADVGGDVGMAYVTRSYRRRRGIGPGPTTGPVAWFAAFDGYQTYVFPHEAGHFAVVLVRPTADAELTVLHDRDAFDAACRAISGVAVWTDPSLAAPTSGVMVGGRLRNVYRPQPGARGLVAVGDAVATTTPTAGRGVAMASMQIEALLRLFDGGEDVDTIGTAFGKWCDAWIRPWVEDHLVTDDEAVRSWQGADVDLGRSLTSAAIVAAADADARIAPLASGYLSMTELPDSLAPAEPLARAVYESGWRAPYGDGPTRDELVELGRAAVARSAARVG
jgi:2-polyprenyl-6-methoxyphenol hydroxylase-like FAD-dependent oxidoreductase